MAIAELAKCTMLRGLFSTIPNRATIKNVFGKRTICSTTPLWKKKMPDRPAPIDEADFTEVFLHGSGPGGQKINKTSSAVQLKHIPTGMVLKIQATRSRTQNRKIARQMLAERVELLEKGKDSRVAIVGEVKRKKKSSAVKKSKRKYKLLAEEKAARTDGVDVESFEEDLVDDNKELEPFENLAQESSQKGNL